MAIRKQAKNFNRSKEVSDVTFLRDTQDLGVAMHKKECNTPFSSSMFLNTTKAQIERVKTELGHYIRRRVSGEFNAAKMNLYGTSSYAQIL